MQRTPIWSLSLLTLDITSDMIGNIKQWKPLSYLASSEHTTQYYLCHDEVPGERDRVRVVLDGVVALQGVAENGLRSDFNLKKKEKSEE